MPKRIQQKTVFKSTQQKNKTTTKQYATIQTNLQICRVSGQNCGRDSGIGSGTDSGIYYGMAFGMDSGRHLGRDSGMDSGRDSSMGSGRGSGTHSGMACSSGLVSLLSRAVTRQKTPTISDKIKEAKLKIVWLY